MHVLASELAILITGCNCEDPRLDFDHDMFLTMQSHHAPYGSTVYIVARLPDSLPPLLSMYTAATDLAL